MYCHLTLTRQSQVHSEHSAQKVMGPLNGPQFDCLGGGRELERVLESSLLHTLTHALLDFVPCSYTALYTYVYRNITQENGNIALGMN